MRQVFPIGLLVAGLASSPAYSQALQNMLDQLAAPATTVEAPVVVNGRFSDVGEQALVVSFETKPEIRLVADPGMTVTPLFSEGVTWLADGEVELRYEGEEYFEPLPTIRIPFAAEDADEVRARINYAFCVIDEQCLFGEAVVEVDLSDLE